MVSFRLAQHWLSFIFKNVNSAISHSFKKLRVRLLLPSSSLHKIQHLNTAGATLNQNQHVQVLMKMDIKLVEQ